MLKHFQVTLLAEKNRFQFIFFCTLLLGLAAHGYCYFNLLFSHDALHLVQDSNSAVAQIGLGRFLNPLYLQLRGSICSSSLIGILSLCYLTISIWLMIMLLDIKQKLLIFCACGILTANTAITFLNASYIGTADVYMLALLLSVAAAYIAAQYRYGFLCSPILLCMSLGLYQSYLQVTVFLCMLSIVKLLLENKPIKTTIFTAAKLLFALLSGLLLYKAVFQYTLTLTGVDIMDSYNGLANVGQFENLAALWQLTKQTWLYPLQYYMTPQISNSQAIAVFNVILGVLLLLSLARILIRRSSSPGKLLLLGCLIFLMPFGINVVYFIANGMEHALMIYSFFLVYLFLLYTLDVNISIPAKKQNQEQTNTPQVFSDIPRWIAVVCLICVIFHNINFSNQLYLKKDLEFQSTLSVMTRIVDRMEQTDGYILGQTPVILVGSLYNSPLSQERPGFEEITGLGCSQNFSTTYYLTYQWYFEQILAYPIQLLDPDEASAFLQYHAVQSIPVFPQKGCCALLDDVLVVKLSD